MGHQRHVGRRNHTFCWRSRNWSVAVWERFEKGFRFHPTNGSPLGHVKINGRRRKTRVDRKGPGNPGGFGTEGSKVQILSPRPLNLGSFRSQTMTRGRFLRLYLAMEVWSRRIMGWEVHDVCLHQHRRGTAVGRSVCQVVQLRVSPQRNSVCPARSTTLGCRCRHPGTSSRPLRARPAAGARTLVRQDSKLGTRYHRGTQSGAQGDEARCGILMSATTTLTLTAGMPCYLSLR
jgi:hypothetical protein